MQRTVLGLLALRLGAVVATADLIDVLWGERPPASCANLVHTYIARLRKVLGPHGAVITTCGGGYRLDVDPMVGTVDAISFASAVNAARQDATRGDAASALAVFEQAMDLWRGCPLADAGDLARTHPTAIAVHRHRLAAAVEYADIAVAACAPVSAATRLIVVIHDEPLHEALNAKLMLLLAASGQQDAALRIFDTVRRRLAEDLGVDPGQELREAHRQVLRQNAAARPKPAIRQWHGPRAHLHHLVGRDADLGQLTGLLRHHRFVTVTGAAGCGKTSLALHLARGHHAGVTVLPLASLTDRDEPARALVSLLEVHGNSLEGALDAAADVLNAADHLLVVDNAEHVTAATATLIARLRGSCPDLTILVTSRQPLGISEEVTWALKPLTVPVGVAVSSATELFTERARQAQPSVDLSDAAAIAHLARRLDGLPLALELAAARVRTMPLHQLVDRLDRNLGILSVEAAPDVDAASADGRARQRHRTLRSAIDWSYRMLTTAEQRTLAQLSVLRGPFPMEAAEAVCHDGDTAMLCTISLIDKSLVVAVASSDTSRLRLLETIREYAGEQLTASGHRAATELRHLHHWLDRARALDSIVAYPERIAAARAIAADLPDAEAALTAAYDAGLIAETVELAMLLQDCWNANPGYPVRGAHWLSAVDRMDDPEPNRLRGEAQLIRGQLLGVIGEAAQARAVLRRALEDTPALDAYARTDLLSLIIQQELIDLDPAALAHSIQLVSAVAAVDDADMRAVAWDVAAAVALEWGREDLAADVIEHLGILISEPSSWLAPLYFGHRATLAVRRHDVQQIRSAVDAAVRAETHASSPSRRYNLRRTVGVALLAINEPTEAATYLRTEIDRLAQSPDTEAASRLLTIPFAEALRRRGKTAAAGECLATGLQAAYVTSNYRAALPAVLTVAALAEMAGDTAVAGALADGWRYLRHRLGLPVPVGYAITADMVGLTDRVHGESEPSAATFDDLIDAARHWITGRVICG